MQEGVRSDLSHSFHYLDDPTGTQICLPECSKKQILFEIPHDEAEIGWCVWIKRQPLELRGFTKFLLYMSISSTAQHTFCRLQAKLISSGKSVYLFLLIVAVRFFKSSSFLLDRLILNALCDLDFIGCFVQLWLPVAEPRWGRRGPWPPQIFYKKISRYICK